MFKTHSATSIIPNEAFTSALGVLLLFIASWLMGCRAERFYNEKNTLAFSQDTVWFDTVFTRKPGSTYPISVTKIVSIKNPENLPVKATFTLAGYKLQTETQTRDPLPCWCTVRGSHP